MGEDLSQYTPWRIAGRYFESCNCDAICPCRMVDGVEGGRSTHGICFGVLSWLIDEGRAGDVELGGLAAAIVCRYDDDEPGSPWSILVHVDARGDERQREALASILLGLVGGDDVLVFLGAEAERSDRGGGQSDRADDRRGKPRAEDRQEGRPPGNPPG